MLRPRVRVEETQTLLYEDDFILLPIPNFWKQTHNVFFGGGRGLEGATLVFRISDVAVVWLREPSSRPSHAHGFTRGALWR